MFPDSEFCTPFCCDFAHSAHEGHLVAIGDEEGRLSLLRTDKDNNMNHAQYHHSFYCHRHGISDVKWSQDDTMLLTASHDRLVRLWDTETRSSLADFVGHEDVVKSVNWHPYNERKKEKKKKKREKFTDGLWKKKYRFTHYRIKRWIFSYLGYSIQPKTSYWFRYEKEGEREIDPTVLIVEDVPSAPVYNCITAIANAHDYGQNNKTTRTSQVEPNVRGTRKQKGKK